MIKKALWASLLLLSTSVISAPSFVFTAIPDQDETQLKKRFDQVAVYLSNKLGVAVKFQPVKSYAASVTAFRNNQVQLAWFGGLSGVRARELTPGAQAIAQGVDDPKFKSYFIAHRSTGLMLSDVFPKAMAGHTFTFGSKGSTSGRLMPEFHIRENLRQAPSKVFTKVGFSGNHSRTIALVESGAYQVGALNYKVWDKAVAEGKVDTQQVQIIWQTPTYPDYQWTIRGDVDQNWGEGFVAKVQQALLDMKAPALLNAFPRKGFIPATNADFLPILKTGRDVGLLDKR